MTELTITPKVENKTARFKGTVAAGEHVAVTIKGGAQWLGDDNGANLTLRVLDLVTGRTLAVFPRPSETVSEPSASADAEPDSWTTAGDDNADLFCELNLNTTRMVAAARHMLRVPVLFVLGDTDAPRTLYFCDRHEVEYWPERIGDTVPYDLDKWPKQIDEWTELVAEFGETIDGHVGDNVRHITALERATWNGKVSISMLAAYVNAAAYDTVTKKILLKNGNSIVAKIDASDFVKDGMVSSVTVVGENLVITFNTDAGKSPISIPLSDFAVQQVQSDWNQQDSSKKDFIKNKPTIPVPVTIDPALSPTSENPVQNKVVTAALNGKREMDDLAYCADDWFVTGGTISRLLLRKVADGQWAGTQDGVQWGLMRIAGEWYFGKTADTSYGGRSDASADATSLSIDIGGTAYLLTKGDRLALVSEIDEIDISGKANKNEMLVTPGTGADADKTTIQLKSGTSATVLTAHQDVSGKASLTDLPYALVTPGEWTFSGSGVDSGREYEMFFDSDQSEWNLNESTDDEETPWIEIGVAHGTGAELSVEFDGVAITATRASLPGHLLDRAGNRVVVSGATPLTLPALTEQGKARDFLVRLEISGSTVPTITFAAPTGETIAYETDGDEFPVPDEAGTWLYSFTETAASTFAVSLKKVNVVTQGGL